MRLGLDIGGTKIEAVVIDNAGEIVYRERCATPKQSYGDFFQAVTEMISRPDWPLISLYRLVLECLARWIAKV